MAYEKTKRPVGRMFAVCLAEAQGFEPWNPFRLPVFKTGAIDHSAKLPAIVFKVGRVNDSRMIF